MPLQFDVIVDAHGGPLPLGKLVARQRERFERGAIHRLERTLAGAGEPLERAMVQFHQQRPDGAVELVEAEKSLVAQAGQNPALGQEHPGLDLGLVAGFSNPGRQHRHAVVRGQLLVAGVQVRLVARGGLDPALEVVRHQQFGNPAEERQAAHMRAEPVGQPLAPGRFHERVVRRPEHGDENLRRMLLTGGGVDDRDGLAAVVDEQPLAGRVSLTQGDGQGLGEGPVMQAKRAVLVALGMSLPVFLPQQFQGHAGPTQLAMHRRPIRLRPLDASRRRRRKQHHFHRPFGQALRQRPTQAGLSRPPQIVRNGGGRNPHRLRDLPIGAMTGMMQPQHFFDFTHG